MAREAGFAGLELIVNSPDLAPGPELDRVSGICPVRSLHAPFRNWTRWGGMLNSWKATTNIANSLDCATHVTMHPPGSRLSALVQNRWFAKAHDLPLLLDAKGRVEFSLENMPWAEASPFARDPLERLMDQCRDKNVGLTFDVCHMGVSGRDVLAALDKVPQGLLFNVHYSDAKGYQEHLTPGAGSLPLADFLARLAQRGYQRYLTLELEPAAFPDSVEDSVRLLDRLRRGILAGLGG